MNVDIVKPFLAAGFDDWYDAYFAGEMPTPPEGLPEGTDFQRSVWAEAKNIPYGSTITYGELARRIGRPKASRAVANALRANPWLIIVPCHRVVAANGLGGFHYGPEAKCALLDHEKFCILSQKS